MNYGHEVKFPKVVRIEPSSLCNLKCIHCPTGTTNANREIMQPETFDIVIQNLIPYIKHIETIVMYHGGEPLINTNFENMVFELKKLGVQKIKTVSNGMLLTNERILSIINCGLDEIEFSLDGLSPKENNFIRRNCDCNVVISNIKKLISNKKLMYSKKPTIYISTTQFINNDFSHSNNLEAPIPDYLLQTFNVELLEGDLDFKTTYAMRWSDMNMSEEIFEVVELEENKDNLNYCDHIMNTITIRVNGDIVACCYDLTGNIILGNIYTNNLMEIWNGELYNEIRMRIHHKNYPNLCKHCNVVNQSKKIYLKIKEGIL